MFYVLFFSLALSQILVTMVLIYICMTINKNFSMTLAVVVVVSDCGTHDHKRPQAFWKVEVAAQKF